MVEEKVSDEQDLPEEQKAVKERTERLEKQKANASDLKNAWEATIQDMEALAEQRREEGWDVLELVAGDTAPVGLDSNEDEGEWGLSYVVGTSDAAAFREAFEAGEFPVYDVYRQLQAGTAYMVTELRDPDTEQIIFVAGAYLRSDGRMLEFTAREREEMYTIVKKLDGTVLGTFHHDGYLKFFPEADRIPEDLSQGWLDEDL